ncbi:MAG: hypothetical protein O3C10_04120 [Chloroflexi bacterium]|nr:hypothetical protein [Chloroflexota bacterium]
MIVASIVVERVAQNIEEDATVRGGAEIASVQANLIGTAFSRVISNIDASGGIDGLFDPAVVYSGYVAGRIDPTTAAYLLMGAGDIGGFLTSNDIRHMSMSIVGGGEVWGTGEKPVGPTDQGFDQAIAENTTVSRLRRQLQLEPESDMGDPVTVDAVESFVPIDFGVVGGPGLMVHIVLDVTNTLDSGIAETKSAVRNATFAVLGSLLALMSAVVFIDELRMSKKNEELIDREQLISRGLDDENRELQRIDQAKNEFLSSVSHELKTPLAAVLGFTRMIEGNKKKNLDEADLGTLRTIERNGWRLNALIDDLLDLSRIESKRIRL